MYNRKVDLNYLLKQKSLFLFGPRGTGKSFLIRETLSAMFQIDLLRTDLYMRLSATPGDLEFLIPPDQKYVVIDEVQKIPEILNEVHRLIESKGIHFLLTGSSIRKLKKESVNWLGGRAWTQNFHPLCFDEILDFDLELYLKYGGLPAIYKSKNPEEDLFAYFDRYLREEIMAEARLRNFPQFSRFLKVAALSNGHMINYASIGRDAEISPSTIREYFYLLQETLVGHVIECWQESTKRKAVQSAKFYFFDPGVVHAILGDFSLPLEGETFGAYFEQFIAMELIAYLSYHRIKKPLNYWRTTDQVEVDFVVEGLFAIEVKAKTKMNKHDLKGLKKIQEEAKFENIIYISRDPVEYFENEIRCLHWKVFLEELWQGKFNR